MDQKDEESSIAGPEQLRRLAHEQHVDLEVGILRPCQADSEMERIVMEGVVPERRGRGDQCGGEHRTLKTPSA